MKQKGCVVAVSFSPDGKYLASGSTDHTVVIWDVKNEEKVHEIPHGGWVKSVSFSPTGELLATASNNKTIVWRLADMHVLVEFDCNNEVKVVSFCPTGKDLVEAETTRVNIWDLSYFLKIPIREIRYTRFPYTISVSQDCRFLAVAGSTYYAVIWNLGSNGLNMQYISLKSDFEVSRVLFSYDNMYLAVGGTRRFRVYKWRTKELVVNKIVTLYTDGVLWFKRFPAWYEWVCFYQQEINMPFANFRDKDISVVVLSHRGFMAIGHRDGTIEIIREGKGI